MEMLNILVEPASTPRSRWNDTIGYYRWAVAFRSLVWSFHPTNTNRNLADNNFVTELRRKLNLAHQIGTLNSVDDTVEFEVNVAGSVEVGIQTQAGFKVDEVS